MPSQQSTDAPVAAGESADLSPIELACLAPVVRIGVTGHRDLTDSAKAGAEATAALSRLLTMLENAKWPTGMVRRAARGPRVLGYRIVSPLAEGGDREVARLVLSSDERLGRRVRELVVPLPFSLEYYRGRDGQPGTDCRDAQSQVEFDSLRSAALWMQPLHRGVPQDDAGRDAWYGDAGSYVVRHCDFLFALWDGRDNAKEGGTAAVVKLALAHGTPVIWIPAARKDAAGADGSTPQDGAARLLTGFPPPDGGAANGLLLSSSQAEAAILGGQGKRQAPAALLLERLGRVAELCRYAERSRRVRQASDEEIAASASAPGAAAVRPVADWLIPAYVAADGLAKRYQRMLRALNRGVYAAAATAVALGALAAILFHAGNWRLLVVFEAAVLVALFLVQAQDLRGECRSRWVAYRAIGEYFRIGRFLALVYPREPRGLEFDRVARLYSWSSEPVSRPWFGPVIERAWDCRPDRQLGEADVPWLRHYLISQWIGDQIRYHQDRRDLHRRWDAVFRWAIRAILLATVLIVVGHVVLEYLGVGGGLSAGWLAFTAIALTSMAGAVNGYAGQQRHNFHSLRFGRMAEELTAISESLAKAATLADLRAHVSAVRRVMLGETTNWYEDMEQQLMDSPT
jgi:SMODS and SLOG-associating 2TM effector domain 1